MKKILIVSVLLIPLMLFTNQVAYCGGEPPTPGTEKLVGPTIEAVIGLREINISGTDYVSLLLSGVCNGTPFTFYDADFAPGDLRSVEAGNLINYRLDIVGICNNNNKYTLNCVDVKNFYKDGGMAIAEVVIMFVVPK